jgi:hypothetical protein
MRRDKLIFNIMDDNYYYIIEIIFKLDSEKREIIGNASYNYLYKLLENKERLMAIESKLFKFVSFEEEKNIELMKKFFINIFSKKYEKKNITLMSGYIKTLCDFFFLDNKSTGVGKYNQFLNVFAEPFFNFLNRVESKNLRFFNNLLSIIEKFNKNLYAIIVNEYYKLHIENSKDDVNYSNKFAIFLILIKPFREHKRSNFVNDGKYIFNLKIVDSEIIINMEIELKEFKKFIKSTDRYLVIYLIEFISGLDYFEKTFNIVKTLLKYNLKTSYIEFKSSTMKMLVIYFQEYNKKLLKVLNKNKLNKEDIEFLEFSLKNYEYLYLFFSNNIYDRPVENVLTYLEILKQNLDLYEGVNNAKNEYKNKFIDIVNRYIYTKFFACSLISLLIKSWYFVKNIAFQILKKPIFKQILNDMKEGLTKEIDNYIFSLRQMDTEGCVLLFMILYHHLGNEYLNYFFSRDCSKLSLNDLDDKNILEYDSPLLLLELFVSFIKARKNNYLKFMEEGDKTNIYDNNYIHTFFILIRTILEAEKESTSVIKGDTLMRYTDQLLNVALFIFELNESFKVYLINNGVSEFSIEENGEEFIGDSEDKRMISIWCTTKYSIECIDLIFDIVNNNYKLLSENEIFINVLQKLEKCLNININLMIDFKHMGAVRIFNDTLLKLTKLVININIAQQSRS